MYLDTAATSPVRREVLEAMWPYLAGGEQGVFANPSSRHEPGRRAARALDEARERIAARLGCRPGEVVLTSGGTEADNLAVRGIVLASSRARRVVTSAIEHDAVLASADALARLHGADVVRLGVAATGLVDAGELADAVRVETALVSIQHASNEVGTVQDIPALADVARAAGAVVHTDAVQSAGWLPVGLDELGVDALTVAGHKLGTPKGVGALAVRRGIPLEPLLHGGGHQRGRRAGTEDVAGAVGLAAALELAAADRERVESVRAARDLLVELVRARVPGALLTGPEPGVQRLPGHTSFCLPGTAGEAVLLELDRAGVACSSGSACAAGSDEPSPVLLALGIPPEVALTAVRLTLPHGFTTDDARTVADRVVEAVARVADLGLPAGGR